MGPPPPPRVEPGVLWVGVAEGLPPPASTQFPAWGSPTHGPCRLPSCSALPGAPQEVVPAQAHEGPWDLHLLLHVHSFLHTQKVLELHTGTCGPLPGRTPLRGELQAGGGGDQHFPGGGVGPGRELGQVGWEGEMEGGRGAWGRAPGGQTHLARSRDFRGFITDPGTLTALPTRGTSSWAAGLRSTPRPPLSRAPAAPASWLIGPEDPSSCRPVRSWGPAPSGSLKARCPLEPPRGSWRRGTRGECWDSAWQEWRKQRAVWGRRPPSPEASVPHADSTALLWAQTGAECGAERRAWT